jgi:hypothetical protein
MSRGRFGSSFREETASPEGRSQGNLGNAKHVRRVEPFRSLLALEFD